MWLVGNTIWDYGNVHDLSVFLSCRWSFNTMIPFIFISCYSVAKKSFHFLFYLLIYIVLTQGYLFYSMGDDNPLLSLFIRMIKLSQMWPLGSRFKLPFLTCPHGSLFNSLFSQELRCSRLIFPGIFPCPSPGSAVSPRSLNTSGEYLGTMIWVRGMKEHNFLNV